MSWIAADWGTSRLRLWHLSAADELLDARSSDEGMGGLAPAEFEPTLRRLAAGWEATTVLTCGMAGAKQGWAEAPYRPLPCPPLGPGLTAAPAEGWTVRLIPGLSQAKPADVMRGEETAIAGWLAANPGWDGVICLPGSHSKWAEVSAGEVVSFRTFLTGELFAAIAGHTVLRHSVGGDEIDAAAFDEALSEALSRPEQLAARLFSIRAEGLLSGLPAAAARGRLSGLLIGAELAAARPWWLGREVALIGAGPLTALYARALAAQAVPTRSAESDPLTLAGLVTAKRLMEGRS
ncbi:2-dehydro-3-deoxygalactonokinase [Pseudoroseicyclus tamaricis]|uniref:2-dehydro-3-deoxygalactonokinase n=1 Tax=Pseudoroseicyclus tamaricis TaxID=2705421 RepID=A0A6B2JVF7_9RHOB|nr:2-dehydro-3-deoxygalactonokinase [Pseudoroseicyclus tamaricis]NDV01875.1 2-dehydro-3-deoxygalactonokinase [Pseudoroseicyclus tamaricis]